MSTDWFVQKNFVGHAGEPLTFKIECDALTANELSTFAMLIAEKAKPFSKVIGIPRGGLRIASLLVPYVSDNIHDPLLIVDDVFTTGKSMEEARGPYMSAGYKVKGAVMFARASTPMWITPIFSLHN